MTALCVAMPRHYERLAAGPPPRGAALTLRLAASLILAVGFGAAVSAFGWAVGSVAWTGALSVAALALVLGTWPWAPRLTVGLALGATLAGLPAILW